MSYVLTILKHLAKSKYCQNSYSAKNIVELRKVSRKKTLAIQRNKQNKNYDAGKRSKKYQEEKQKKAKLPKNTNSNTVARVDMVGMNHNEVLTYANVSILHQYFFDTTYFHLLLGLRIQSFKSQFSSSPKKIP